MLVKSLRTGTPWLWVNIPKTATTAVLKSLFPYMDYKEQKHSIYQELIDTHGKYRAFTLVRHPVDRFRSSLNHAFNICECGKCKFNIDELPTTQEAVMFIGDLLKMKYAFGPTFFEQLYCNRLNKIHMDLVKSFQQKFNSKIEIADIDYCFRWAAFVDQTFVLSGSHGNIDIFKYENKNAYFEFIDRELGYKIQDVWYRKYPNKLNIDFTNSTIRSMLYELYREDFVNFNYTI